MDTDPAAKDQPTSETLELFDRLGHFFGFLSADAAGHIMWGGKLAVRKTSFLDEWIRVSVS